MNKRLQHAIERIRSLPEERQTLAARILEEIASFEDEPYQLSDIERSLVKEGLADLDDGRTVSESEMAAFWNRHRS